MELNTLVYDKKDRIGIIALNRPKRMNALNPEMVVELDRLFENIAADEAVRAVVITGGKKFFCGGADLAALQNLRSASDVHEFASQSQRVFRRIEMLEKPVIAAVNGLALGGGV